MALFPLFLLLVLSAGDLASSDISSSPSPVPVLAPSPDSHSPFSAPSPVLRSPSPYSAPSPTPNPNPLSPPAPPISAPTPSLPPSPVPAPANELIHDDGNGPEHEDETADGEGKENGGGLSGGQKAGVAIGVLAAVAMVGFGAVVYRKRQDNIRRARYGYGTSRVEMI